LPTQKASTEKTKRAVLSQRSKGNRFKFCKFATVWMKLITYILTFTVLLLTVQPVIDAIPFTSETKQTCCISAKCSPISDNQNSDKESDKEENRMCNPFQACGSCLLICVTTPFYLTPENNISTEEFFGDQSFIPSQIISDFWQPPKLV
jgi:hypothetical protein